MNDEQWSETGEDWLADNQAGYVPPGGTPMVTSWHCHECGTWSSKGEREDHECERAILVAHQLEIFDQQFTFYLKTTQGQFAQYYAKREVGAS